MRSTLSSPAVRQPKRLLREGGGPGPVPIVAILSLLVLAASLTLMACSPSTHESSALTVTDLLGRSVEVPRKPDRIVTTHPTATETLYRAGGVAVGRDTASKYPAEALDLPTVGGAYSISTEAVAALDPDLVLIEALTQASLVDPLEQLGIPVIAVRAASLEDIVQSLALVAEVVDTDDAAAQVITDIQNRIDVAKENAPEGKSILIFIADAQNNVYAAKPASYPGTMAALIGLDNLAADLPDAGGRYAGYASFSAEQATQTNPDVVFTITPAPAPAPRLSVVLSQMPGFKEIPVVKAGHIVELDPVLFLQAPGPRIADAVEGMLNIVKSL
jgi:iron complex transport system substrate-binding protein